MEGGVGKENFDHSSQALAFCKMTSRAFSSWIINEFENYEAQYVMLGSHNTDEMDSKTPET